MADRVVRSLFAIMSAPSLQLFERILQREEPEGVLAFVAQLVVERTNERIVRGLARAREVKDHTAPVGAQTPTPRDEFAAIVQPDHLRIDIIPASLILRRDHVFATMAEPGIDHYR